MKPIRGLPHPVTAIKNYLFIMFHTNSPWLLAPHVYQTLVFQGRGQHSTPTEGQTSTPLVPLEELPPRKSAKSLSFGSGLSEKDLRIEDGIAVLPIHGVLLRRSEGFDLMEGITSYEAIEKNLKIALNTTDVKGILLDIDSPGGEVSGLFDLADVIYQARALKPIWAIANDTAYSAAYALASSADKLYATSTGSVGSIGVIASHIDQSAYNERKGFKVTSITAGAHKNDYSPHQPLTETATLALQAEVDRLYGMFVDTVSRNRNLSPDDIRATEAGLSHGQDAITQKLADGVQSFNQTLVDMQKHVSSRQLTSPPLSRKDQFMPNLKKPSASSDENLESVAGIEAQPFDNADINAEASPPTVTSTPSYNNSRPSKEMADRQAFILAAEERGREQYRHQALEIIELCTLARLPDQIVPLLKQNMSVDAARETLLNQLAQNTQDAIYAHTNPQSEIDKGPSWVIQEAKSRAGITDKPQGH